MNNILRYSIVFVVGLLAGMLIALFTLETGKGDGEEHSIKEAQLHHTIDSLKLEQIKSDTVIVKINNTKTRIKYEYIKDTIYLTKLSFDSIKVLFTKEYPRYSNHK